MDRYADLVKNLAGSDEDTSALFAEAYKGTPLSERVAAWLKLHEDTEPLAGDDPYENLAENAVMPFIEEQGEKGLDVAIIEEAFDLDLNSSIDIEVYGNERTWVALHLAYAKLPASDKSRLFKKAIEKRPDGRVVQEMYGHISTQISGPVSKFVPIISNCYLNTGWDIEELKEAFHVFADTMVEQAAEKA